MPKETNDIIDSLKKADKTIQDLILGYYSFPISISPKFNTVTLGQFLAQTDRLLEQIQAFVKSNPSQEELNKVKQRLTYIPLGILNNNFNLMNNLNSIINTYDDKAFMNKKIDELLKTEQYKDKTKADVIEEYNKILSELKSKRDKLKNQSNFIKKKFEAISKYIDDILTKYKHTKEEKDNIAAIQKIIKQRVNGINKLLNKHKEVNFTGIPEQLEYLENNLNDKVTGNNIASLLTLQRIANNLTKDVINRIKGYNPEKEKRQKLLVKEQEGVLEERKRKRLEEEEKLKKGLNWSDRDKFIVGWVTKKSDDGTLYKATLTPSELEAILRKQYPYVSDKNWRILLSVRDLRNPKDRAALWQIMPRFNINPNEEKKYPVKDEDVKAIITRLTKYHDVPYKWVTDDKQMNIIRDRLSHGENIHKIIGELNQLYTQKYKLNQAVGELKQENEKFRRMIKAKEISKKFGIPDSIDLEGILNGFNWDLNKFVNAIKAIHIKRIQKAINLVNELTNNGKLIGQDWYNGLIDKIKNDATFTKDIDKIKSIVNNFIAQYQNKIQQQQQPKKEQEI